MTLAHPLLPHLQNAGWQTDRAGVTSRPCPVMMSYHKADRPCSLARLAWHPRLQKVRLR